MINWTMQLAVFLISFPFALILSVNRYFSEKWDNPTVVWITSLAFVLLVVMPISIGVDLIW